MILLNITLKVILRIGMIFLLIICSFKEHTDDNRTGYHVLHLNLVEDRLLCCNIENSNTRVRINLMIAEYALLTLTLTH